MSKKVVICVNSFSPLLGGCEKVVQKLAEYLGQHYEVIVMTRRYPGRRHDSFIDYKVVEYLPNDATGFLKGLKRMSPDVILIYSDLFDFFRFLISQPILNCHLIIAPCGANYVHNNRSFAKTLHKQSNHINSIICHSIYDRDYKFYNTDRFAHKITVIPNGVDLEEFDQNNTTREEIAQQLNIKQEDIQKRWVLNVSNFFPGKGQEHLVDILNRLPVDEFIYIQVYSKMSFAVGGTLEMKWRIDLSKTKINHVLAKDISRSLVVSLFKNSNVFVFPSEKEVAPLVLLECMAAKLPWASTDVGNAKGLSGGICIAAAKDTKYYSVIDERVKTLMTKAILKIWDMPIIAEEGRYDIEQSMTWDKILPQYHSVVESVCA